jgi:capsular exopolysaccharide synthesis family protein
MTPSSPDVPKILILALLGSLSLALGFVKLLDRLDNVFRTANDVEERTGLPCVGMIPNLKRARVRRRDRRIRSIFAEGVRTVRTSLLSSPGLPTKVLVVTSSIPAEGKSVMAAALARALAEAGRRTLLIDCDLRCPSVAELTSYSDGPQLADLLLGKISIEASIDCKVNAGVEVIGSKNPVPNAQDLLAGREMERLIKRARAKYDFVVLDTPPIMVVSDAALVSTLADGVLYVVRWGHTPRNTVLNGLKRLRAGSCRIAGVVLSRVDLKHHNKFRFYDQGHYLSLYDKRYATIKSGQ